MNKKKQNELEILKMVFGKTIADSFFPSETPDFLLKISDEHTHGVEITEIFQSESHARIAKIDGYTGEILSSKEYRHKKDQIVFPIKKAIYQARNDDEGKEIEVLFQPVPSLDERLSILLETVTQKSLKSSSYAKASNQTDLIVNDYAGLFRNNNFSTFIHGLSTYPKRGELINSDFREIFLVTENFKKERFYCPLKLVLFCQDLFLIRKAILSNIPSDDCKKMCKEAFLYCLFLEGHKKAYVRIDDGVFCFLDGSHRIKFGQKVEVNGLGFGFTFPTDYSPISEISDIVDAKCKEFSKEILDKRQKMSGGYEFMIKIKDV